MSQGTKKEKSLPVIHCHECLKTATPKVTFLNGGPHASYCQHCHALLQCFDLACVSNVSFKKKGIKAATFLVGIILYNYLMLNLLFIVVNWVDWGNIVKWFE
ncbi:hypothetical protein AYK60_08505 [Vibrio sp. SBT000027]|nr:hypothetical protein AYK60_08505 [Vibrio sp. SBT000027]